MFVWVQVLFQAYDISQLSADLIQSLIKHKIILKNTMASNISEEYRCLLDILSCPVCKQIVQQAHICPNCSKFYCLNCIIRQLAEEETCLNCNRFLQVSMLVNCQRLCKQLKETLDKSAHKTNMIENKIRKKSIVFCNSHQLQKTYYCKTCQEPLCSDCSVLTEEHRGHEFIKLSIIKANYQQRISDMIDKIRQMRKTLKKKLLPTEAKSQIREISSQKNISSLQTTLKFLKESISKKTKCLIYENKKDINKYETQLQNANIKYKQLLNLLKNCSKVQFVEQQYSKFAEEIIMLIDDINQSNLVMAKINMKIKPIVKYQSYIQPNYQNYTFFIDNYAEKMDKDTFFYTEQVGNLLGNVWRLKIYPKGIIHETDNNIQNQNKKLIKKSSKTQQYFAIFIQLMDGPSKITKQKHQIILVNQLNQTKNFLRQYESQFDVGECWGYQHFIKLSQLYNQGFYNDENDCMQIKLNICPANYYQATIDQFNAINNKQQILKYRQNTIQKLKYNNKMIKQQRSTSSLIQIEEQKIKLI